MNRFRRAPHVALLIVAMVAFAAAPALAGGKGERPYKGLEHGSVVVDFAGCVERPGTGGAVVDCPFTTDSTANFTHLGKTTGTSTGIATLDFGNPCEGEGSATVTNVGSGVFTAANGDELWLDFENTLCFGPSESALTGTQTITGGTGRFAGATGSAVLSGTSFDDSTYDIRPAGTIGY
jgi:hypothetical protein